MYDKVSSSYEQSSGYQSPTPSGTGTGPYMTPSSSPGPRHRYSDPSVGSQPTRHSPLANSVFTASELSECDTDYDSAAASVATNHLGLHTHYISRTAVPLHPSFRSPLGFDDSHGPASRPRVYSVSRVESAPRLFVPGQHLQQPSFANPSPTLSGYRKKLPTPPPPPAGDLAYERSGQRAISMYTSVSADPRLGGAVSAMANHHPPTNDPHAMVPAPSPAPIVDNHTWRRDAPLPSSSPPDVMRPSHGRHARRASSHYDPSQGPSEATASSSFLYKVTNSPPRDSVLSENSRPSPRSTSYPLTSTPVQEDSSRDSPSPPRPRSTYPALPPTPTTFESTVVGIPHSFATNLGASTLSAPSDAPSFIESLRKSHRPPGVPKTTPREPWKTTSPVGATMHVNSDSMLEGVSATSTFLMPLRSDTSGVDDTASVRQFNDAKDRILRSQLNRTYLLVPNTIITLATTILLAVIVGVFAAGADFRPLAPKPAPARLDLSAGWEIGYLVLSSTSLLVSLIRLGEGYQSHFEYRIPSPRRLQVTAALDFGLALFWGIVPSVVLFVETAAPGSGLRANACRYIGAYDFQWLSKSPDHMNLPLICTLTTLAACLGYAATTAHLVSGVYSVWLMKLVWGIRSFRRHRYLRLGPSLNPPCGPSSSGGGGGDDGAVAGPVGSVRDVWRALCGKLTSSGSSSAAVRPHKERPLLPSKPGYLHPSEALDDGVEIEPLSVDEGNRQSQRYHSNYSVRGERHTPVGAMGRVRHWSSMAAQAWF
ncbi:hypothetical protein IWQ60_000270 [Tieghemiomyces parasiticus]|uniref:Uncharacterized protein n=1 Tax=Tieghemiomyces parasiticus TaxID=78921 RepID=A0A9W8AN05_9FUNG|nr:hypothetical protein IWQ60_000270 [Tieghemiomyces parasiticus]